MPNELTSDDLDLVWVALRAYKRAQDLLAARGEPNDAQAAHDLSRRVLAMRDAGKAHGSMRCVKLGHTYREDGVCAECGALNVTVRK